MSNTNADQLRQDALTIWQAAVAAVDSARLVRECVSTSAHSITVCGHEWAPRNAGRICVVGAGKGGAGMALGIEEALGERWLARTHGWVNVPEDCVQSLRTIHLHGARPAGINEPTPAGVRGTKEILSQVQSLSKDDLCLVLISGGGSALLPAPIDGVSLADLQQVTRTLMRSGATIEELNSVRRALSSVKGGGLLRACKAGMLIAMIISDVIGDHLETIASGPTVDIKREPEQAFKVLKHFQHTTAARFPDSVWNVLSDTDKPPAPSTSVKSRYWNHIIGNNHTAVQAAADEARRLGYSVQDCKFDQGGVAADVGSSIANRALEIQRQARPGERICIVDGGEPTVNLVPTDGPQKGGRNQELVLSALEVLSHHHAQGIAILSGGTDGEDGPTDAAGAVVDPALLSRVRQSRITPRDFLRVNNSYPFFEQFDGLIKTGPTHTNVMDVRVTCLVGQATDHQ